MEKFHEDQDKAEDKKYNSRQLGGRELRGRREFAAAASTGDYPTLTVREVEISDPPGMANAK